MTLQEFRNYCLAKKATEKTYPFDQTTMVIKVMGKMFALADTIDFQSINLKCDPNYSEQLRETYEAIQPGWHMNKKLWITLSLHSDVPDKLVYELIDHSYQQVVSKLSKKLQAELAAL